MNKNMSKKSKILGWIICIFLIATSLIYLNYFVMGSYVSTYSTFVEETEIDDYHIKIKGSTINSATGFSGYKLTYKDKVLYVKLKYSVVSWFNPLGSFFIDEGGVFEGVQKAYLQGPEEDDLKLIWSK